MKRKLLAAMLSGSILLSLFSVTAAAADSVPLPRQGNGVTYYATTADEICHICDMVMPGDNVVVAGSFAMDVPLLLDHALLTIEEGSTLTLAAGILVEGDSTIRGGGTIQRTDGNSGALITVADSASLLLEDVTIDGGARWGERDENDPISAALLRGTVNSGLTATAPLVLSSGDLSVKNAVLQNNDNTAPGFDAVDTGTSAIFIYGNGSLALDNTTIRNNKANTQYGGAVTGRSATTTITVNGGEYYGNAGNSGGFFTWGKLYLNSGTIRNNYAEADLGGGVRTATGATLYMNGGTVTRNLTEKYGGGIAMYNSTGYFNGGTVSENIQKGPSKDGFAGGGGMLLFGGKAVLNGTDFINNTAVEGGGISMNSNPVALTINAGNISGNTAEKGGGVRNCYGTITLNGGTITNNDADLGGGIYIAPSSVSKLVMEKGEVSDNTDQTGSSNIYYDAPTTDGHNNDASGFYTLTMDCQITSATGKSFALTNVVPHFDGKTCTTNLYGCELSHFLPQNPGFTFAYWATEDGKEFTDSTPITGDMTIYAHWYCDGEHDLTMTQDGTTRTVACARCDYVSTTETVVVSDYTGVFDGQPHTVTLSAPEGVDVTWYQEDNITKYNGKPSFTDVGEYTVHYKATGSSLSKDETGTAKVTITPLDLGSWRQKCVYSYDSTEKSLYSDKLSTYFDITGTTQATEPGEYLMTCTLKREYVGNVKWSVENDTNSHSWLLDPANYSAAGKYPAGSNSLILAWAIEGSSKTPVTLTFAEPTVSKEVPDFAAAETFTNPLSGVPADGTVSYTSSKPHVAEVNADGVVTLHSVGNTLITAKYAGDDDYETASTSYVVAVTSNTEENHAFMDDPAVPPTCVEDGHTDGKICRVCGKTWESTVIPATGHTPAPAVRENVIEATYHTPGAYDNVIYCSVCNTKLSSTTVVIPQLTSPTDPGPSYDDSDDDFDDYRTPSVVITDPAGGSASVTGSTVKLTPAEGYEIGEITVNGKRVAVPKDGVLTCVKSGAKVVVTFSKKEVPAPSEGKENPFVDVAVDAYYFDAVRWANETGVTTGVDATHFAPDWSVTRAQAVTFLWRAAGSPAPHGGPSSFGDVEPGSYYETAVAWALEQKITKGTSATTFSPDMICTRAQIVTLLARYSGVQDADTETSYSDVAADDYFAAAVKWADEAEVTYGTGDGLFCPHADCTRGQIVTFLWRLTR